MKNWINTQLEILKQKAIKLGKLLLALLAIWATVRFDAFWITIPALVAYHIYMIPTYWNRYLDNQRKKWNEHIANVDKDAKHWKVNKKNRFGIEV
jgi:hypothetical protein